MYKKFFFFNNIIINKKFLFFIFYFLFFIFIFFFIFIYILFYYLFFKKKNYTCVLCNIKKNEDEDALKLTMSNNWAHVLCSLFIPEIKYGNAKIMEPVECIHMIDEKKWKKVNNKMIKKKKKKIKNLKKINK